MKKEYTVEEIFEDIPGDPENVMMKIPPEVLEKMGWEEGCDEGCTEGCDVGSMIGCEVGCPEG